ncbi:hypothetical protein BS78_01G136200 [Paspalum vaginatum]|nr:hypothetical protein BS78_01G136200 [Paspalum vaginatum]
MTCSYCKGENHNVRGCPIKKMSVRPESSYIAEVQPVDDDAIPSNFVPEMHTQDEPIVSQLNTQGAPSVEQMTQDGNAPTYCNLMSEMSSTMLLHMMEQAGQSTSTHAAPHALPDSQFINSNVFVPRPAILTTATKQRRATVRKKKVTAPEKEGGVLQKKGAAKGKKKKTI